MVNGQIVGLTVVNMSSNVNTERLREMFPLVKIVSWDLEKDDKPTHWEQGLWQGFGCDMSFLLVVEVFVVFRWKITVSRSVCADDTNHKYNANKYTK
jgi:hypothetical protein